MPPIVLADSSAPLPLRRIGKEVKRPPPDGSAFRPSIDAQESGNTIPLVHTHAFDKSIKSSISVYMIFVKDSLSDVNKTQMNESGSKEDLELSTFLNQFQDVFIDDIPGELPPKQGDDDHAIELIPGSSPPNKPPYRVSQAQQEEIMRQVNELVEKGMVRPSSSPFCSPVLLVHKKDGTYRMCVDYRALNKITIKNRFPLPRIEDLFDKLQGSTYFSRIDLKSGYHQIRIVNEDILKTAFRTTFCLYEYLVMPFGLTNAPATFNRMMERIFRPHRNFTGVFFDDVIIYSKSMEEHKKHLQVIFQALRDNKLFINQKKSEFFLQEIQYLGHIISKSSIRMDPSKLEVIKEWPNPRNLHELRSFIGMCAYYRRFIEKFSLIASPLHDLTKKNVKYVWTEGKQEAFDKLKQKLTSQPVLVLPDLSKPFEVQCDACGDCLGAVLLQEGHAIAYESRRLNSDEQILGIYEKELLAVLHALDSWKHYLLGTPFILRTDHQSLKYFMTQTKLSDKQMRWANFLSRFNFHIAHFAGKHNQVADALSRRPKVNAVSIATHNDLSSMIDEYAIDPDFKDVISAIALGKKEEPFTLEDGYLLYGNRLFKGRQRIRVFGQEQHLSTQITSLPTVVCSSRWSPSTMSERKGERVRLYVRGVILGYKRGKSNQYPSTSLLQIEGVNTTEEVNWYLGKRVAYVYKAKTKKNGTLYRSIWGRITKPHGNSGVVRGKFRKNLPPSSLGGRVRVFMYPSRI
ncbi:hypothetical protein L7F22_065958 [Adiantum nelumboides]|nr:hypothetical protein [Adiantum nelumboides]